MSSLYGKGRSAVQIARDVTAAIRNKRLTAGDTLPPVRELARQLRVNPNTVAAAYKQLRDGGVIVTSGRKGTRVAGALARTELVAAVPDGLRDLASGNVDNALLPQLTGAWLETMSLTSYDAHEDDPGLLDCARDWLGSQGVPVAALGVFSSALDTIERALRARLAPGQTVLVEDPGWPPLFALLRSLRLNISPLAVDEQGAVVPQDNRRGAQPKAIILTPRAQNPTGATMSAERLAHFVKTARRNEALLILDDYWGPLATSALPALTHLPDEWLFVASTSKFLGPDLRVAAAAASPNLMIDLRRQQSIGPRWVSLLLQRLAARLWRELETSRGLSHARKSYANRRQKLLEALSEQGVPASISGEGLHLWIEVDNEATVAQAMAARGWAVQPGAPFSLRGSAAIRLSLGNLRDQDAASLATDLAAALTARQRAIV